MGLAETILIASGLLTLSMLAAGLFRNISIPYSVVLVLMGLILSEFGQFWQPFAVLHEFRLTPQLVFFVLLPALIFESGLGLNARQLLKDIAPVLSMAIPALLISSFLIGFGLWVIVGIPFTLALLFGALISATDPVAVIALFKELGAPLRLNVLIEGESLLNDATAIVLFGIILSMLLSGASITFSSGLFAVVKFVWVFFGGAVVGVIMGLLISELLQRLRSAVSEILAMSVVLAYASFILAEHWLHVSGVMATLSAAITLNVFGLSRIEQNVKPALLEIWEFVALVANSLLFLLVGLSIDAMQLLEHSGIIAIAVLVVLLARAAAVYSMAPLSSRLFHLPKISLPERHIMWWGGLKGGLAIAIVLSVPESLPGRDLMINMTLGVVLFTLLVNATTIRPLMQRLKMDRFDNDENVELQRGLQHAAETSGRMLANYQQLGVMSEHLRGQIASSIGNYFLQKTPNLEAGQGWREVYLTALRTESAMLDQLFESALISQYTLLDLRNSLSRDRDNLNQMQSLKDISAIKPEQSFFIRLERVVLKFSREKNWAAGFLSAYQYRRLQQRIERDIASIALTRSVIDMLEQRDDFETSSRARVLELYQLRFSRWSERLDRLRQEFSAPFEVLEQRMFSRSSLKVAELNALEEFHHGELGVKAFNRIESLIKDLLNKLNNRPLHMGVLTQHSLASISLFSGLSDDALKVLSNHVTAVSFMPDDIIIGEGEGGDALYIIQHGEAEVSKGGKVIAGIKQGDFFGEKGLLGDHVRSATVTAKTMLSLLRLGRRDILKIADSHEEIRQRLQQVHAERQHQNEG
jgi:CPA1 family monovalent cation:H+ antiporter